MRKLNFISEMKIKKGFTIKTLKIIGFQQLSNFFLSTDII